MERFLCKRIRTRTQQQDETHEHIETGCKNKESVKKAKNHRTHGNQLIRVIHHRNQQIQQDDYINDGVCAEHQHSPEASEYFDAIQFEAV